MAIQYPCISDAWQLINGPENIIHPVSENLMEDEYNHVSEELVYCLTNVPGPGLVGGIPADLGGCLCTVGIIK